MHVENKYALIATELAQLQALVNECHQDDLATPEMHWPLLTKSSRFASIFLIKKHNQIIGFLKLFFFYKHAAEMVLLVHPSARQQRVATKLLQAATPLLKYNQINELRFSFKSETCHWLEKRKAHYQYSDNFLSHPLKQLTKNQHPVISANQHDISELLILDKCCFKEPTLTALRLNELLNQKDYDIFIIKIKNEAIAKLHLKHHQHTSEIFDVAVHPSHQRKGYAESLIKYALLLTQQRQRDAAILNVEGENKKAISLYIKNGFELKSTQYYWSIPIDNEEAKL